MSLRSDSQKTQTTYLNQSNVNSVADSEYSLPPEYLNPVESPSYLSPGETDYLPPSNAIESVTNTSGAHATHRLEFDELNRKLSNNNFRMYLFN